jgi:hypothetical protein
MGLLRIVLAALFLSACSGGNPVGPIVPLNQEFTLAPGGAVTVEGSNTRVQFVEVTGDSRCPANARCIWAGDAVVEIRIAEPGSSSDYDLHTADAQHAVATHRDFQVRLLGLQPYPFTDRPVAPADYRVTLEVAR